jgi:hypothetical protein
MVDARYAGVLRTQRAEEADNSNGADRSVQSADSPFLVLSPELRNKMYEYALVVPEKPVQLPASAQRPGLPQSCRQIRHEASGIYYTHNQFHLAPDRVAQAVSARLAPKVIKWFRRLDAKHYSVLKIIYVGQVKCCNPCTRGAIRRLGQEVRQLGIDLPPNVLAAAPRNFGNGKGLAYVMEDGSEIRVESSDS